MSDKLVGRLAYCAYYKVVSGRHQVANGGKAQSQPQPSSTDLAFFEYRGPGSNWAAKHCVCGYFEVAHTMPHKSSRVCDKFTPREPAEFDSYYCGCFGWD